MEVIYISCPFCNENDFDFIGLKIHLLNGWCDAFNAVVIPIPDRGENKGRKDT